MAAVSLFWYNGEAAVTSCENNLKRMYINLSSLACVHRWQPFPPNRQLPLCDSANLVLRLYLRLKKQVNSENRKVIIEVWLATDFLASLNNQDASLKLFLVNVYPLLRKLRPVFSQEQISYCKPLRLVGHLFTH